MEHWHDMMQTQLEAPNIVRKNQIQVQNHYIDALKCYKSLYIYIFQSENNKSLYHLPSCCLSTNYRGKEQIQILCKEW